MYQRQTLLLGALLGGVLCAPLFVFAQTSTSTAEQPAAIDPSSQTQEILSRILQKMADDAMTAEEIVSKSIADNLEVSTSPKSPGPGELVRVSIQSYVTDINKALITWTINNKIELSGLGEKSFSFRNGQSGETTKVTVSITTNNGEVATKDLFYSPVGVTIFWEADTYTPPFYKGKPLLSPQSRVKAVATPDNTGTKNALDAGNLVYTWEKEGSVQSSVSGYGKNSFSFVAPQPYRRTNVSVRVSSTDDSINSEAKIIPTLTTPIIVFYENNPLLGTVYNHSLGTSIDLMQKEISVSAAPYYFSNDKDSALLSYNWSTNGKATQNEGKSITFRNESGAKGIATISLAVKGIKQTFQSASQTLRINFIEDTSAKPVF